MKILIAADMEGVTGVVHWDQVNTNHPEYGRFRRLMTQDVNAAIAGAFDGGATEVVVSDGHAWGRNILIEELDARARLNSGTPAPLSMVQGVDQGVDGLMFVGYHAAVGTQSAILDHTWSDERVGQLRLNGQPLGEIGLNAAVAGHFGVPLLMIAGDQNACAEAANLVGPVETAVVKVATGRWAAECLPPAETYRLISNAAQRAVERMKDGDVPAPLRLETPLLVEIDFMQSEMADKAAIMPGAERGAERGEGRTVSFSAQDMLTAYRAFRALQTLAKG